MARRDSNPRRGSYAVLVALTAVVGMGFGALSVDVVMIRLGQAQSQDVADAATQAALHVLRSSGSTVQATNAAKAVVAKNTVFGKVPSLDKLEFGEWDANTHTLTVGAASTNAVRATVGRTGMNSLEMLFSKIWGYSTVPVEGKSISAARALHMVLDMDITLSWHNWHNTQNDFFNARTGALIVMDQMRTTHGPDDYIGMAVFNGPRAWQYTPFTKLANTAATNTERAKWAAMNIASHAGVPKVPPAAPCNYYSGGSKNNFTTPAGGCYPQMPRCYDDEAFTDHTTGLTAAKAMFQAKLDPMVYRALVVLTDGQPVAVPASITQRGAFLDPWTMYTGAHPHSIGQIQTESMAATQDMWNTLEVNTWVVSYVQNNAFLQTMPKGDGYFKQTSDSNVLIDIFTDIAEGLPLAIVE